MVCFRFLQCVTCRDNYTEISLFLIEKCEVWLYCRSARDFKLSPSYYPGQWVQRIKNITEGSAAGNVTRRQFSSRYLYGFLLIRIFTHLFEETKYWHVDYSFHNVETLQYYVHDSIELVLIDKLIINIIFVCTNVMLKKHYWNKVDSILCILRKRICFFGQKSWDKSHLFKKISKLIDDN